MTIRTQKLNVVQCIVRPVSIYMMELKWNWLTLPLCSTAQLATLVFHSLLKQPALQSPRVLNSSVNENLLKRTSVVVVCCTFQNGGAEKVRCVQPKFSNSLLDHLIVPTGRSQTNLFKHCSDCVTGCNDFFQLLVRVSSFSHHHTELENSLVPVTSQKLGSGLPSPLRVRVPRC
jgi:hypothetical protein